MTRRRKRRLFPLGRHGYTMLLLTYCCALTHTFPNLPHKKMAEPKQHCARGKSLTETAHIAIVFRHDDPSDGFRVIFLATHRRRVARESRRERDK